MTILDDQHDLDRDQSDVWKIRIEGTGARHDNALLVCERFRERLEWYVGVRPTDKKNTSSRDEHPVTQGEFGTSITDGK